MCHSFMSFIYFQIELDFKHLHPNEADNLILKWSSFLSNLETLALESRIDDEVGKDLVKLLKSDEFKELEESKCSLSWFISSALFDCSILIVLKLYCVFYLCR